MNKKLIIASALAFILLTTFVMALTLKWQRQVLTCSDTDGGVVVNITGTASGLTLTGMNYTYTDSCVNNSTLSEYVCSTSGNSTFLQNWQENCNCVSGACV